MIRYEENRIYTAECNICGCLFTVEKNSQTDMELFMKKNGWEIWKSYNVHQPNCVCYNCKSNELLKEENELLKEEIELLRLELRVRG